MADRLYIEKKINDLVIPKIDSTKFLNLDKLSVERIELFMFAMALGLKENKNINLTTSHGFILETSIKPTQMSLITSLLAEKLINSNEIEKISDKDAAYTLAQKYANAGFEYLSAYLDKLNSDKEEEIMWEMLSELDDKYEQLFGE